MMGIASVSTIWAIYLNSFLNNESYVGFIVSIFSIASFMTYFYSVPILEKGNKTILYLASSIILVFAYILFSFLPFFPVVFLLGLLLVIVLAVNITSFGIIVRDSSRDNSVSKNEGLLYTALNTAWLIGPLLAGFIASRFGERSVFILAAILVGCSLIIFKRFSIKDSRTEKKADTNPIKIAKEFFSKKERRMAYILGTGVNFWFSLIYIYMPMHIIQSGINESYVSYFLFAVALPLIIFEYHFGKLAGKQGFKKVFFKGYSILFISALVAFFLSNTFLVMGILVLSSIGVAMVESTTEAYFFDVVNKSEQDKFYGPYNTAMDIGHLFATFLSAVILLFLPFKFIFLLFSLGMLIMIFVSFRIRNVIESRKGKNTHKINK